MPKFCVGEQDLPEWQREEFEQLKAFLASRDTCIPLPDGSEIDEWQIMESFVDTVADSRMKEDLQLAVHGKGAFRRFKDTADRFGLLDKWPAWREQPLREKALEWCRENNFEVEEQRLRQEQIVITQKWGRSPLAEQLRLAEARPNPLVCPPFQAKADLYCHYILGSCNKSP